VLYVFIFSSFLRERLRTHSIESSGKLKISPEQHWDFTAEDLKDLGEIGRGAYGSVNKMVHKPSNQIMAVKVSVTLSECYCSFGLPL